jgi:putative transcriptional regulator
MKPSPAHHPDTQRLLALATGAADSPLRLMVETHLSLCPLCSREVARLNAPGGVLLEAVPEAPLPPGLFERIWAEASRQDVPRHTEALPLPTALLAELPPPESWRWQSLMSGGCRVAQVMRDARDGSSLYLVHLPPGSRFPRHAHRGEEEGMVVSGRAIEGVRRLGVGDWSVYPPGSEHALVGDPQEGCWALTRVEREGVRMAGWRGLLQRVQSHLVH